MINLGEASFWYDETVQARTALAPSLKESMALVPLNKPPLFYLVEYFFARFSASEWGLRLPSCLAGAASVWVFGKWVKRLLQNEFIAFTAAALLALSPLHIAFSQEARPYALSLLFVLLSMNALFALLEKPGIGRMVLFSLFTALSCWTLYFGLGLWLLQAGWLFGLFLWIRLHPVPDSMRWDKKGVSYGLAGVALALVLLLPLLFRIPGGGADKGFPAPPLNHWLFVQLLGWFAFGTGEGFVWTAAIPIGLCMLTGTIAGLYRKKSPTSFLLAWLILIQGGQLFLYYRFDHWISPRYQLVFLPPFLALAAMGLDYILGICSPGTRSRILTLFLLLIPLLFLVWGPLEKRRQWKSDIRAVTSELADKAVPGDLVVGSGFDTFYIYSFYRDLFYPQAPPVCRMEEFFESFRKIRESDHIWLIWHRVFCRPDYSIPQTLAPGLPQNPPIQPVLTRVKGGWKAGKALLQVERFRKEMGKLRLSFPVTLSMKGTIEDQLDSAWYPPEDWNEGGVSWIRGRNARLFLIYDNVKPTTVTISLFPLSVEDFPLQKVTVNWDETPLIRENPLPPGRFTTLELPIPAHAHIAGTLHCLGLEFAHSAREAGLDLEDPRDLSTAVGFLRFE